MAVIRKLGVRSRFLCVHAKPVKSKWKNMLVLRLSTGTSRSVSSSHARKGVLPRPCGRNVRGQGGSSWQFELEGAKLSLCCAALDRGTPLAISVISVLAISPVPTSKTKKNSIVVLHYHFFVQLQCASSRLNLVIHERG